MTRGLRRAEVIARRLDAAAFAGTRGHEALTRWRGGGKEEACDELDATWSGRPFRAQADDDRLRFFTVYETVGMLG